jgi:uncharacterized phage protein gp47/JayE
MIKLFDDDKPTDYQGIATELTNSLRESGLISDTGTGGVARILIETFAGEMATFYAILEKAHRAGYLETADGKALDNVVAILGVRRADPGLLRGQVVFGRTTPTDKDIVIPAGTRVTGPPMDDGDPLPIMETVEQARIPRGARSVSVAVQELPDGEVSDVPSLPPGALRIMPTPLLGVEQISNPDPVVRGGQQENDENLRARAGAVLREGQKATAESIEASVLSMGIQSVKVVENPDGRIGCIQVRVGDPKLEKNLLRQRSVIEIVREAKAAGIHLEVQFVRSVYCRLSLTIEPEDENMEDDTFHEVAKDLKKAVTDFINGLGLGTPLSRKKLDAVILGHKAVRGAELAMQTFTMEYPDVEDTGTRDLPSGDWYIGPLENATTDPDGGGGVQVLPKQALRARMGLAVTVMKTGLDTDAVRQYVRAAADDYIKRLLPDKENKRTIKFQGLSDALREKAQVTDLQSSRITHLADGTIDDLDEKHDVKLADGERLDVVRIDVKVGA